MNMKKIIFILSFFVFIFYEIVTGLKKQVESLEKRIEELENRK